MFKQTKNITKKLHGLILISFVSYGISAVLFFLIHLVSTDKPTILLIFLVIFLLAGAVSSGFASSLTFFHDLFCEPLENGQIEELEDMLFQKKNSFREKYDFQKRQ